jgi:hypothetical protein
MGKIIIFCVVVTFASHNFFGIVARNAIYYPWEFATEDVTELFILNIW